MLLSHKLFNNSIARSSAYLQRCTGRVTIFVTEFQSSRMLLGQTTSSNSQRLASTHLGSYDRREVQEETTPPKIQLNFSSHSFAFSHRKTSELLRALIVLRACAIDTLVNHSYKLFTLGQRILGENLLGKVVAPFYYQFVAGDSEEELAATTRSLQRVNVKLMVAPMLETDIGEEHDLEAMYQKNVDKTLYLVELASRYGKQNGIQPICQTKHTAHLSADVLARISSAYQSLDEQQKAEAIAVLADCMEAHRTHCSPKAATLSLDMLGLNPEELSQLLDSIPRLVKIGDKCVREDVILTVDAEYTYTNPAINLLTLAMMKVFNEVHRRPLIWNTYQGYLKAGRHNLEHDLNLVRILGDFSFGVKIVRGAYLERERSLAQEEGRPDPVNDTYVDTNKSYNSMVDVMLREVKANPDSRSLIVATHNEESVNLAAAKIQELGLDPQAGNVVFGQVYGMADNITLPLAHSGYLVYKSIPYGSTAEVLPYLSRRAQENRAVLRGARKERQLLAQEIRSRIAFFK